MMLVLTPGSLLGLDSKDLVLVDLACFLITLICFALIQMPFYCCHRSWWVLCESFFPLSRETDEEIFPEYLHQCCLGWAEQCCMAECH
jgi:hypothetical protein